MVDDVIRNKRVNGVGVECNLQYRLEELLLSVYNSKNYSKWHTVICSRVFDIVRGDLSGMGIRQLL